MKPSKFFTDRLLSLLCLYFVWTAPLFAQETAQEAFDVKANYVKSEHRIPMRDGVKLFTSVYVPRDQSQKYPVMLNRTPYSVSPYGPDAYKESIGPSPLFAKEGYVFVYQDVRGRLMSEGEYVNIRPHKPKKSGPSDTDESTDTYDTIEWLLKNIPNHNGRVGMWGISYPGFYVSVGMLDAHPALKAASPQAPIADWFIGDDFHHNGALFLPHAFNFMAVFGRPRPAPTTESPPAFEHGTPDGYKFFLNLGPLGNANEKYFKGDISFWNDLMKHPTYDEFWRERNVLQHLRNIKPAVMTVGGWFDAEDLYGALKTYGTIERENPRTQNILVMGPWFHGGWSRSDGDMLGAVSFGSKTAVYYRENIELPFFNCHLKDKCEKKLPEASIFETGSNKWRAYEQWPPKNVIQKALYFHARGRLSFDAPIEKATETFDEYVSDPSKPVPVIAGTAIGMKREYMIDDQRFATTRPDVLVYETEALTEDVTVAGPITARLYVSTTGTDADYVVKLIDVYQDNAPDNEPNPAGIKMGGYQMLVRGEPMRARFRNSYAKPEAMQPGKMTKVEFELPDAHHTFLKGHKIMVQIQSTWFPLVDRNPQKFVDIYNATEADFQKATQRVYHSGSAGSHLKLYVMK